ncbi:hypothetical protein PRZ48_006357 [Zasmidium cellare]|uniref:Uncharacterized protein n=1 Tax=Zasmidium cellare TaxID=395010 RepID=A0ABR0ENW2_ZASCE|nr:hypothetical protein PRZ48_006357 [Zasmidium cellare]
MLVIGVESARRGKDKLGLDLVYRAGALVRSLPNADGTSGPVAELLAKRVSGHFVDLNMGLYNRALQRLSHASDGHTGLTGYEEQLRTRSVTWGHRAATIARDFREAYGYKIVPPFVIHMAAVATLTLLRSMEVQSTTASYPRPIIGSSMSDAEREEVNTSFAECFRCLLAAGLQEMHARGTARMVYCTALELKVRLPDSVQQMISLVAESAWQPSDLHQLSSTYPNWGLVNHSESSMEQILRKWDELAIEDQASVASSEAGFTAAA